MAQIQIADDTEQAKKNRMGAGGNRLENPKLAKALKERHPYWELKKDLWQKLLDLFEGENLSRYIFKHTRESKASHQQRAKRVAYRNYIEAVVTLRRHYIYSKGITRSALSRELESQLREMQEQGGDPESVLPMETRFNQEWETEFLNNVDRSGGHIDRFMADLTDLVCVFGKMYVLIDLPRIDAPIRNEQDRQAAGIRPYFVTYTPLDVVNWELDKDGKLLWIRFFEEPAEEISPLESRDDKTKSMMKEVYAGPSTEMSKGATEPGKNVAQYRTFTRDEWIVHRVKNDTVEVVGHGKHRLGEVPVVSVYAKRSARYTFGPVSPIQDIATLQQAILNLDSLIDEATYQQTISILVMGRQPIQSDDLIISETNVLEVSPTSLPPYFLAPNQTPLQFMEQRIQLFAQEIYRLSKFGGGFGLEPKAVAPTTAAYEFNLTNRSLADLAENLQTAEFEMHRIWFKWFAQEYRGYVDYPDEFSIQSFMEDLQTITTAGMAIRSPTFRRQLEKRVARKILSSDDEETITKIEGEIDIIPDRTDSFTGPIFWDALMQEVYNPAQGGFPIGKVGQLLQQAEQAGVDVTSLRPNATLATEQMAMQQQQQAENHEMQKEGQVHKAETDEAKIALQAKKGTEKKPVPKKKAKAK